MQRESLHFDVVIVGAGPAGLAAACRLGQLSQASNLNLSICVVDKGADIGAHIVSGAVIEPRALDELFPDWRERGAPVDAPVTADRFTWLRSARAAHRIPSPLVPVPMRNEGNFVASLGRLCRWLAAEAEALGCDLLPAFAAVEALFDDENRIIGVATGPKGIAADGSEKPNAEPGYELFAKYVVLAEGCRGSLTQSLERRYALRAGRDPQHYGLGIKEIWEIDPSLHEPGLVDHTVGWPLAGGTEGGGFVYHAREPRIYLGFVTALNYRNPYFSPYGEFQRWKTHPYIRRVLENGRRVGYAARAVNKGGLRSLPKLTFPGGVLTGCAAGFLNGAKIKGSHAAMKSGMLAAEAIAAALEAGDGGRDLEEYSVAFRDSWLHAELHAARNFSAGMTRLGTLLGSALAFVEHNVLRGRTPLDIPHPEPDHVALAPASSAQRIDYPAPDGVVSFDRLASVHLSNIAHEEDQPVHLELADPNVPIEQNLAVYDEPAQRYCPAAVYEVVANDSGESRFRINAANCVHCKTCEIKDPAQNITWVPPEGGSGPNYSDM